MSNRLIVATALALSCAGPALAAPFDTMAHMPARKAFDMPQRVGQGCLAGGRLLAHAAYRPGADASAIKCGQLLTTDTLVTVHRWDHT